MNAPMQKGLLTLRPDLSLQIALGDTALDAELDVASAYQLAEMLLANTAQLVPWFGRADAALIEQAHALAFLAIKVTTAALRRPPLSPKERELHVRAIKYASAAVNALNVEITGDLNASLEYRESDRAAAADAAAAGRER